MEINAKKRQKRTSNFSEEEKRLLIAEVKTWPRIWDISDQLHSNKNAVDQAWANIGESLNKPGSECKAAWVSLRESYRYHAKASGKSKSGSEGGELISEPCFSGDIDWEFADDMAFLPNVSIKRRTFKSMNQAKDTGNSTPIESASQYEYAPNQSKKPRSRDSERWNKFDELIETQTNLIKMRETVDTPFKEAFTSFEWLLKQLPRSVADDVCLEFTQTLIQKVNEQKQIAKDQGGSMPDQDCSTNAI